MNVTVTRDPDDRHPDITLGQMEVAEHDIATLEQPWIPSDEAKGGTKYISCVPDGEYRLVPHKSEDHPNSYALINEDLDVYHYPQDVPKEKRGKARTVCLIHVGNFLADTQGCIMPGMRHTEMVDHRKGGADLEQEKAVASSGAAMKLIREALGQEEHTLTIKRKETTVLELDTADKTDPNELASENIQKVFT